MKQRRLMPDFFDKKIAIFGGSFNPIHLGHLLNGLDIIEKLNYDYVVFIPANIPSHKPLNNLVYSKHRLKMIKSSIKNIKPFLFSDIELKRGGVSYTIDTVNELMQIYNTRNKLGIIFGDDLLEELGSWKDFDRLLEISDLICLTRNNEIETNKKSNNKFNNKINFINNRVIEISSTEIRNRIINKLNIDFMVTNEVKKYIFINKLYSRND
jgi:nicotinate-nucleotide adenylyltransferase